MEINDIIYEKYTFEEFTEINKLFEIKEDNIDIIKSCIDVIKLNTNILNSLKKQLAIKNQELNNLNKLFNENTKLYKNIIFLVKC